MVTKKFRTCPKSEKNVIKPPPKKRVLALVQIFAQKKKEKGVVPYTSAFRNDLDYRNLKSKNKRKKA
jgi:hypothetical protein